ncbi:protein-tyrosine phosphatase family protein [Spelaeicoccus albus]|uniref:Uncharacterized protein n=1 Tax=Spelaeicoccus albus TaxID=1280376 RepID=A0A7Z0ABM2_9MICO|nr:hypothetical protein [Spelaeicoccus albus]NYI67201.1 hypothetical protein [Spelaeicoccus albus]
MTSDQPTKRERYVERERAAEKNSPATLHDRFVGGVMAAAACAIVLIPTILSAHNSRYIALVAFLVLIGMAVYRYARGGVTNVFRPNAYDGAVVGMWLGAFFNMIGGVHIFGILNPIAVVGRIFVLIVFSLIAGGLTWMLRRTGPAKSRASAHTIE